MSNFSSTDAVLSLLTVQGLLLAALGLLASLGGTSDPQLADLRVESGRIVRVVGVALLAAGVATGAAWVLTFTGGSFGGPVRALLAAGVAVASVAATWIGWIVVRHSA